MYIDESILNIFVIVDSIFFQYVHDEHEMEQVFKEIVNEKFPIHVIIHNVLLHFVYVQ